jgi:RNA polymerase sigma factor (sigma-70 family)
VESLSELDDADLIGRCRTGQAGAWSVLVRRYQRLVYTIVRRSGLPDELAADVFQTTFERLFQHLDHLNDAARVRAWIVTTARRECLRVAAQRRREVPLDASDPDGDELPESPQGPAAEDPGPPDLLEHLQLLHRLRGAIDRLDPVPRRFAELAFLQDPPLSYEVLAAELGMAVGSIGPTRARVLARLKKLLED